MIKVRLSPSVQEYCQAMAELVNQVCEENTITGVDRENIADFFPPRVDLLEFGTPGLLMHPKIELLLPDIFLVDGQPDGCIQINTSEYFGVMSVYVILEDDRGNLIESDYALENDLMRNNWCYIPSTSVTSGTTVSVRVIAMDKLGGVGIRSESLTF